MEPVRNQYGVGPKNRARIDPSSSRNMVEIKICPENSLTPFFSEITSQ